MTTVKVAKKALLIGLFLLAGLADAVSTGLLWNCEVAGGMFVEQNSLYFPFLSTAVLLPSAMFCLWISPSKKVGALFAGGLLCMAWTGAVNNLIVLCSVIFY